MLRIGIIREGKTPADSRTPLSPIQVASFSQNPLIDIVVQPSDVRVFKNSEYVKEGCIMQEDLSDRDILMGVKEVPIDQLINNKTYFFFSHTIKKQSYNRILLQACVEKNIKLIDYEVLVNDHGQRLIAFGKFAGMVGAHNALWTWGERTKDFQIPRMYTFDDYSAAKNQYQKTKFPPVKIVLTGTGRVAGGAAMVLKDMGIKKITPLDYVTKSYQYPVFTQVNSFYYAKRKDGETFDSVQDFYSNPQEYESDFYHFLPVSDIMINGIYWDNLAPAFFTVDQMNSNDFNIKVISDVTCDIAPVSSIPSTLKASTIDEPVFGFDPRSGKESAPYQSNIIDMMTIDNLPNELPKDASVAFGEMFIKEILPELQKTESTVLTKATITENKGLGKHFEYLADYLSGA